MFLYSSFLPAVMIQRIQVVSQAFTDKPCAGPRVPRSPIAVYSSYYTFADRFILAILLSLSPECLSTVGKG